MIKWVERGVLLAAILSMLFVWPYGGIREDKKDSSLSEDYGYTEPLQVGEYASQYFVAETDFLKTLEIAVNYNQEEERNGLLGLEIWKEDQKIYEGVIPYDAMESTTFFPAVIETRLKRGAVYEYRIVNQSISENLPQVVYTITEKAHVPENQQLVVHEATVDGQALNRYTWREKLDAVSVLEIDSFIAIVAAMIYAVLEQWKRKEKRTMKWVKFRIKTVTEAEDIIISTLYDLGLEGAQIEDKVPLTAMEKEQMFVDILPDGPEDDGIAYLSFFVEEKEDGSLEVAGEKTTTEAVLADVKRELEDLRQFMDIGEASVVVDETEDIDWINNWKQYFHQFYIDDILVIPSWENIKPEDTDKMVLHIDPGTAFGTGMHETTQLCIRQLRKFITPDTELLDVGTGSGILAILSLMFGAKHAVGTDLDICAVEAVAQNCEVNGIDPAQFDMMIGNIITDKEVQDKVGYECYDIVVANILADVLVPLTPVIVHQLKKGGIYITSGIIDDKEQTVVEAVKAAGLEVLEVTYQGEWVSVTARKN